MKKSLIILTRNEIEGLTALFDSIPISAFDEAFAVDYNSTDGTREFLTKKGIRLVEQEKRGRGEAFRLGSSIATGEILAFFSPDGNEDPADLPRLATLVEQGADLAVASRFLPGSRNEEAASKLPLRSWANQAFTLLANLFFGGKMTDTINGYRVIRKDKFNALDLDAEGFAIEYQMSIRAMKRKYKIVEIPTVEGDRIGGQSTASSIPTGLKVLRILLREIIDRKN